MIKFNYLKIVENKRREILQNFDKKSLFFIIYIYFLFRKI